MFVSCVIDGSINVGFKKTSSTGNGTSVVCKYLS